MCSSGCVNKQAIRDQAFKDGYEVGMGRFAWENAALHHMYIRLVELDREEELESHFVENMWLSIIRLDQFVRDENANKENREAAGRILKKVAEYFRENPRLIQEPVGTNLAYEVKSGLKQKIAEEDFDENQEAILYKMTEGNSGVFDQLEVAFDELSLQLYERDVETQKILNRLWNAEQAAGENASRLTP